MMFKIINKITFFFLLVLFCLPIQAGRGDGNMIQDLYEGMNYKDIFDQRKILSKCPWILKKEGLEVVTFTPKKGGLMGKLKNFLNWIACGCLQEIRKDKILKKLEKCNNSLPEYDYNSDYDLSNLVYKGKKECVFKIDDKKVKSKYDEATKILKDALVNDFKNKKQISMKRSLFEPALYCGLDLGCFGAGAYFIPNKTGSGFSAFVLVNELLWNVKRFSTAFYSIFISPLGDPLERYEILYAKRKPYLSKALQEAIEDKFGVARKSNQAMQSVVRFARIALNLPLKSKQLKSLSQSKKKVNELLNGYDEKVAEIIRNKFFNHYKRFSKKAGALETPKSVLYLQGPPGVGKTYMTEKLAQFMEAPIVKLTAIENVQSIIGSEKNPGSLLEAICRPEVARNAIILIDEVDHVVNKDNSSLQLFLPLLEPDAKYFYSPYLKVNIDISHFFFVLAGNTPIKNEALKSRVTTVVVENLKKSTKKKIINKMFTNQIRKNTMLMIKIDKLIKEDKDKGVRTLRSKVNDCINSYYMKNYKGKPKKKYDKKNQ